MRKFKEVLSWSLVILLFATLTGCPGVEQTTDADEGVANVRRTIILQYTRQGRLTPAVRERLMALTTSDELQDYAKQQDEAYLDQLPIDGRLCMEMLNEVVRIGPRWSGSVGMLKQQQILDKHFSNLGGKVEYQRFRARNPISKQGVETVDMANMIIRWHPQRTRRILLCAHYDTRPFPDNDPDPGKRRGVFVGANDGGSGVAVLCALAEKMEEFESEFGVDMVLFDGEELVYNSSRDPFFLGSTHFAREYAATSQRQKYVAGILLDMVADADLQIYQEVNSRRMAPRVVQQVWATAKRIGVPELRPSARHEVRDDHLPLNEIAKIPTIDLIDFDYPSPQKRETYFHTTEDTVDKCSAISMAHVGWVVWEWLKGLK
ncbi:MAG: M28 family peptidase [Pirellulales bacterium]|nr:M28 family peptidase [Pirellulales bacterium]